MLRVLEQTKIRLNRTIRRFQAQKAIYPFTPDAVPARKPGEVWAFWVVRNEALRLPFVLKYHFDRGVSRMIVLDNQSTDGTRDLLAGDPRIHVFTTAQPFAGNKIVWQELLLRRYGEGYWNLILDADELFAYPHMDALSIPDLADYLEQQQAEALHCLFMEMFSRQKLGEMHYRAGDDLLEEAPWFDDGPYIKVAFHPVFNGEAPTHIWMGGTRQRLFAEEFGASKYPLFKYHRRQFLRLGLHTIEGARIANEQGAVLHFKYLQDFKEKAVREAARGVYWNGAAEYKAYARRFEQDGDFSLWHEGAHRFENWRQLVRLGLMHDSPALVDFLQKRKTVMAREP